MTCNECDSWIAKSFDDLGYTAYHNKRRQPTMITTILTTLLSLALAPDAEAELLAANAMRAQLNIPAQATPSGYYWVSEDALYMIGWPTISGDCWTHTTATNGNQTIKCDKAGEDHCSSSVTYTDGPDLWMIETSSSCETGIEIRYYDGGPTTNGTFAFPISHSTKTKL